MLVKLPRRFEKSSIHSFLQQVIDKDMEPKASHITFDFCSLQFIEPSAISLLSNIFDWLKIKNVTTEFKCPELFGFKEMCPIKYLDDSLFFKEYLGAPLSQDAQIRSSTLPLQKVSVSESLQWLDNNLLPWLGRCLTAQAEEMATIKVCIGELFNNIRDHSTENIGCLYAQHYPRNNEVKIAIADFGVGIPNRVKTKYPLVQNDSQALEMAIQDTFTTKTSPRNLGAGLHTLIQNVVKTNKGSVHLISNYGILNCTEADNTVKVDSFDKAGYYPGTFIEVVLKTNEIDAILDREEEFEWEM